MATALTTTVRFVDHTFIDWCSYHLALFDRLFVWLDDPAEVSSRYLPHHHSRVDVSPGQQDMRASTLSTILNRQEANVLRALDRCRDLGIEWLCHLDSDEILHPYGPALEWPAAADSGMIVFPNHEVCATWEADNPFRDCVHFKLNRRVPFDYYANGKAAARVGDHTRPWGSHAFWGYEGGAETSSWACVLHYGAPTFERWLAKYSALGPFGDYWRDDPADPIKLDFHKQSRDTVASALASGQLDHARRFFGRAVWSREQIDAGLRNGFVGRFSPFSP